MENRRQPGDAAVTKKYLHLLERKYEKFFEEYEGPKLKLKMGMELKEMSGYVQEFINNLAA